MKNTGIKITPTCPKWSQKNTASLSKVVENLKAPKPQTATEKLKNAHILFKKSLPLIQEKTPKINAHIKASNPDNANKFTIIYSSFI